MTYRGDGVGRRDDTKPISRPVPTVEIRAPAAPASPVAAPAGKRPGVIRRTIGAVFIGWGLTVLLFSAWSNPPPWPAHIRHPSVKRLMDLACGNYAPALVWTPENTDGPGVIYSVTCQQGVQLIAGGP